MDKYLENIGLDGSLTGLNGFFNRTPGIVEVNSEITYKIIEDLQEVSFNCLYPHLLVRFYETGIFKSNNINIEQTIIDEVNKYLFIKNNLNVSYLRENNMSFIEEEDYIKMRTWVNSIYNKELRNYTSMIFELYRQYMRQFWDDFISENELRWLYVDTDCAFVSGGPKSLDLINNIGIPFDLIHHDFFYIERPKKYVITDSSNIKIKGYRFQPDEVINIMKSKIRNKKIDSLLNN